MDTKLIQLEQMYLQMLFDKNSIILQLQNQVSNLEQKVQELQLNNNNT